MTILELRDQGTRGCHPAPLGVAIGRYPDPAAVGTAGPSSGPPGLRKRANRHAPRQTNPLGAIMGVRVLGGLRKWSGSTRVLVSFSSCSQLDLFVVKPQAARDQYPRRRLLDRICVVLSRSSSASSCSRCTSTIFFTAWETAMRTQRAADHLAGRSADEMRPEEVHAPGPQAGHERRRLRAVARSPSEGHPGAGTLRQQDRLAGHAEHLSGWLIEYSLSLDNIWTVIAIIFAHFAIPKRYQHRVLFWESWALVA